jgi:hypothetical protein
MLAAKWVLSRPQWLGGRTGAATQCRCLMPAQIHPSMCVWVDNRTIFTATTNTIHHMPTWPNRLIMFRPPNNRLDHAYSVCSISEWMILAVWSSRMDTQEWASHCSDHSALTRHDARPALSRCCCRAGYYTYINNCKHACCNIDRSDTNGRYDMKLFQFSRNWPALFRGYTPAPFWTRLRFEYIEWLQSSLCACCYVVVVLNWFVDWWKTNVH